MLCPWGTKTGQRALIDMSHACGGPWGPTTSAS
jgi:hypothetical protein